MQAITLIKQRISKVIKPKEITLFHFDREHEKIYEINKLLNMMKIKYNEYEYNENEYNENRIYMPNKGYSTIYEMLNAWTYKKLLIFKYIKCAKNHKSSDCPINQHVLTAEIYILLIIKAMKYEKKS
ncbi:LOW QUALITY PROTEIN: hypothetical protein V1478_005082 [Vespula squamosa]|uniref:Uncharacterized protein n=1 Tax=Vespula squamosa TaxID=30214 RepID=A0ABD2BD59_VESSQ